MNKKFIASVLAFTMLVGMSAPVMADTVTKNYDELTGTFTVSGDGTLQKPNVKITVPTEASFVVNPYKVALGEEAYSALGVDNADVLKAVSGNQIISKTADLVNDSDVNVAVTIEEFKIHAGGDYRKDQKRYVGGVVSGNYVNGFPITVASGSVAKKKNAVKSIQLSMVLMADKSATKKVTIKGVSDRKADKNGNITQNAGVTKKRAIVIPKDKTGSISFTGSVNESPVKFYTTTNAKGKTVKVNEKDDWTSDDEVSVSYKITLTPTTLTK
jgi:hypothetical protein